MTVKAIPTIGEFGIPGMPGSLKVISAVIGVTSDADVNIADTTQADSDGVWHVFDIPKKTYVKDLSVWVMTGFSGGSVGVGDSADSDGFFSDTLLDPGTTTLVPARASDVAGAYKHGKSYTDSDFIGIDVSGTVNTAGKARLYLEYATEIEST